MIHHFQHFHKAEFVSLSALFGAIAGWLPTAALLLPVIWYSMLIIEKIYDRFFRKND